MTEYDVVYECPAMGMRVKPYPIAGPGKLTLGESGLTVHGTRHGGRRMGVLVVVGAFLLIGIIDYFLHLSVVELSILAVAALAPALWSGSRKVDADQPFDVVIPWDAVTRKLEAAPQRPGVFVVTAKKANPKGELYFSVAEEQAGDFEDAFQAGKSAG